jgi:3-hydroxymyristoyl/3-hydroxydecanoyl-(acyl carrier protein) dehydratase
MNAILSARAVASLPLSYLRMVPHRYPMRLVDRFEVIEPRSYGRAIKQVSVNDTMLCAVGKQIFVPNSLVVDALGQVGIAVMAPGDGTLPGVWYLATIDDVEFGAAARPGDTIVLEARISRVWKTTVRIAIHAHIAERTVARGVMVLATGELN